jgi:hypothetical protein
MSEPDYIVVRPAADLPPGFLPSALDGKWFDREMVKYAVSFTAYPGSAVAVPSGRFEVRDDGAVAEVWEVRP